MPNTTVTRRYAFEAAHFLPRVPDTHKCKRMHGHNYEIEITISGHVDAHSGFLIDFFDLDNVVDPIVALLDHRVLNDIEGLENPTAEFIAQWFWRKIGPNCTAVRVYETKACWAEYVA